MAPWHYAEMPPLSYRHSPLLGADNEYVLGGILGLSADEIRRLEEARVVY
jgi:crotonobetainyl-CoA:carnitine CoA-transferase CaiB-like acyl-CoA transferase